MGQGFANFADALFFCVLLPAWGMRIIPDNMHFIVALLLKLGVDRPHSPTFIFHTIPASHVGVLIHFKKYGCISAYPKKINACESSSSALGFDASELNDVLSRVGNMQARQYRRSLFLIALSSRLPTMHTDYMFAKIFPASGRVVALGALEPFLFMDQHVTAQHFRLFTRKSAAFANVLLPHVQTLVRIQVAHSLETGATLFTHERLCIAVREFMS
jgi:hypothetical protein